MIDRSSPHVRRPSAPACVLLLVAPAVVYPVVPDEAAVLCAAGRVAQPAARLCRACCRSATRMFFGAAAYVCAPRRQGVGLGRALGLLAGVGSGGGARLRSPGCWRSGAWASHFSMITLAFAQLVYFVALRAPFTGGEDGMQDVPRGRCSACVDIERQPGPVLRRAGDRGVRVLARSSGSSTRRSARCSRRSATTSGARISLGYRVAPLKLLAFVRCRPRWRASPAQPRSSCSRSPRSPDVRLRRFPARRADGDPGRHPDAWLGPAGRRAALLVTHPELSGGPRRVGADPAGRRLRGGGAAVPARHRWASSSTGATKRRLRAGQAERARPREAGTAAAAERR